MRWWIRNYFLIVGQVKMNMNMVKRGGFISCWACFTWVGSVSLSVMGIGGVGGGWRCVVLLLNRRRRLFLYKESFPVLRIVLVRCNVFCQ